MSALLETTIEDLCGERQKSQKPILIKEEHQQSLPEPAAEFSLKLVETIGPDQPDEVIPEEAVLSLEYGFPEEFLMSGLYAPGQGLLYQSSPFYQELRLIYAANDGDGNERRPQGWVMEEQEAETMTREEAEEAIADVQFAAASGAAGEVDSRTRERLATYFIFDQSLAHLMARMHWVTNDVDYSRRF